MRVMRARPVLGWIVAGEVGLSVGWGELQFTR